MPYAMIRRTIRPTSRIGRDLPALTSTETVSRPGAPVPEAVMGEPPDAALKVQRSIAEGPDRAPRRPSLSRAASRPSSWGCSSRSARSGVYALSNPEHYNQYNHFVWQADAFLHGRAWIPYPEAATATTPGNEYFQDVYPAARGRGVHGPGAAAVPAAAGGRPAAVRRALGPAVDQESRRDRARRRRRVHGVVDARRAAGSRSGCGRSRRSCSPPGRSGGGPRPSAARGTSRTSSR